MNEMTHDHAKFRSMIDGTQQDWDIIAREQKEFAPNNGKRILDHLKLLGGDYGGFPVDRLEHCLQTATRAHRDGRDEEYVVMALLHDIGDRSEEHTSDLQSLMRISHAVFCWKK